MNLLLVLTTLLAVQIAPTRAWTWTLYDGEGPLVLAEEVPDTPNLRTTLECEAGGGRVTFTLYEATTPGGYATARAGELSTTAQILPSRGDKAEVVLRTDLPVFAAFASSGEMTLALGDQERRVSVGRPHLAKLRRFAERCAA